MRVSNNNIWNGDQTNVKREAVSFTN
jgi:hypothetical protein